MGAYNLIWLTNNSNHSYPNIWIPRQANGVILYNHGNGGTLRDWYALLKFYSERFDVAVFGVEFPGYGPAEGSPNESSVNDNVYTSLEYLQSIGYPLENIILMGYSIGTGPAIQIASELCSKGTPPGALVTISAFTSIRDIVHDLKVSRVLNVIAPIVLMERWNSSDNIALVSCPTMLVHGQLDALIPVTHSETLHDRCIASEKLLHICPSADHTRFKEPADTIEPIGFFLRAHFKPKNGIRIQIDLDSVACPITVIKAFEKKEREKEGKVTEKEGKTRRGSSSSNRSDDNDDGVNVSHDVANVGCWDISPMVNWIMEIGSSASSALTNTVNSAGNGVQKGVDEDEESSSAPTSEKKKSFMSIPRPFGSSKNKTSEPVPEDNSAMSALVAFFTAFNRHDIESLISLLDDKVVAVYPDVKFNWSTISEARTKYQNIFAADPNIRIHYIISGTKQETHIVSASVKYSYSRCSHCVDKIYSELDIALHNGKII
eukprot:CAMPEP_0196761876 /NCGR_PEP_ID=MMETSP1095-20130614/1186_1 /TAXON_ID=96789 ORGANISM="Chromulina nebulosa, Strain UTEXLB2642" /NCGR_SAMPLE_ID=MMETSP1095 /ASSEMBLY_ACC=CAM_ASM_000446 /LENGTH=489 /DNA_ID=CAMNT_0042111931 /DNA_START=152 /DNA_END=1618 /DNA_ORIENTATION=+